MSPALRAIALQYLGIRPILGHDELKVFSTLQEDLRKIGINLNQIARAINANKTDKIKDLPDKLAEVKLLVLTLFHEFEHATKQAQKLYK